jgi:hypothetical protein
MNKGWQIPAETGSLLSYREASPGLKNAGERFIQNIV